MYEKLYALIAKWEEEWQELQDTAAAYRKDGLDINAHEVQAYAAHLRKRIDELTELVRE